MNHLFDKLCIVMVQTSHAGNIGSAARAMKTMGLRDLRLVNPKQADSAEARALASGADDILDQTRLYNSLQEATADCHYVIGSSARSERSLSWPQMDARSCGEWVAQHLKQQKIAIVFGRERSGLSNEELQQCQALVHIPMAVNGYSLNIAAALQIIAYECFVASQQQTTLSSSKFTHELDEEPATVEAMEGFFKHLETALIEVKYLDPSNPRLLMRRLRRLFGRVTPTQSEVNILRGILSAFQGRKFQRRSS